MNDDSRKSWWSEHLTGILLLFGWISHLAYRFGAEWIRAGC